MTVARLTRSSSILVDGARLRSLRESAGWTQEMAAQRAGYSDRWIRKLERGGPVNRQSLKDVLDAYRDADPCFHADPRAYIRPLQGEQVDDLARIWFQRIYNRRDVDAIDELAHEDVTLISEGTVQHGRTAIRQRLLRILAAFDPLQVTIERIFWEGNTAIAFWNVSKRHVGEFLGIPPTGRWITLRGNSLTEFRGGKIIKVLDHWDLHVLTQQLKGQPHRSI